MTPLWDQHACLPLQPDADVGYLTRFSRPGPTYVSVNVGYAPQTHADSTNLLAHFRSAISRRSDLTVVASLDEIDAAGERGQIAVGFDLDNVHRFVERLDQKDVHALARFGIIALAVGLLMIGDEFDLSSGVAVTTAALAATMLNYNLWLNSWAGVFISLFISLAIGAFNGFMVMRTGIPSFLITLATFLMLQGINLAVTKMVTGQVATPTIADMEGFPSAQAVFSSTIHVFGVGLKVTVLWWVLFTAVATYVLMRTRVGNWIFAVGGNQDSARAVGVPVTKVKIGLFMFVAFCAWFVGQHLLYAYDTVQSGQGVGNEFLYIIGAVIGAMIVLGIWRMIDGGAK